MWLPAFSVGKFCFAAGGKLWSLNYPVADQSPVMLIEIELMFALFV